jgi:hypothetical protein
MIKKMGVYRYCQGKGMTPIGYDDDINEVIHSDRRRGTRWKMARHSHASRRV